MAVRTTMLHSFMLFLFVEQAVGVVKTNRLHFIGLETEFKKFATKHARSFEVGTSGYNERFKLFSQRLQQIELLNKRPNQSWKAGVNMLADRTDEELAQLCGWRGGVASARSNFRMSGRNSMMLYRKPSLPHEHEWSELFNTNFIRDQGSCGSCWALTATTVLAAHSELYASNRTFSTQELVECVPNPHKCGGTGGCEGATVELAFQYVMVRGDKTPKENPYAGTNLFGCEDTLNTEELASIADFSEVSFHEGGSAGLEFGMRGWEKLAVNKYEPLMRAVAELGPVAVSLAANKNFMFYSSGVFDSCDWVINHAVTLVGYGKDKELQKKYWKIQNSWGPDWGEAGKMRILRQDDDEKNCGVDRQPEDGTGCEGGPTEVEVCGTCGILYDSVVPHFVKIQES